ncbi:unnamed protein product [Symbiodinium sp. CCMP2592]|nr:unnamed protein product [Symbiodinium sp. CCMP2592]
MARRWSLRPSIQGKLIDGKFRISHQGSLQSHLPQWHWILTGVGNHFGWPRRPSISPIQVERLLGNNLVDDAGEVNSMPEPHEASGEKSRTAHRMQNFWVAAAVCTHCQKNASNGTANGLRP